MFFFHFDVVLVVKLFPLFDATTQHILCAMCCAAMRKREQRAHLLFFHYHGGHTIRTVRLALSSRRPEVIWPEST